jgi:uncharacterized membrane protein
MEQKHLHFHVPPSVQHLMSRHKPARDVNKEHDDSLSGLERLAMYITEHVGTMGFFIIIFVWTLFWLGWNFLAPKNLVFDPPMGFVFWLFISNMIQIFLMPLIMIGQNLQGRHAERRAENDYEINCKAEKEVETILLHLEHQNDLILAMVRKLGIDGAELKEAKEIIRAHEKEAYGEPTAAES